MKFTASHLQKGRGNGKSVHSKNKVSSSLKPHKLKGNKTLKNKMSANLGFV